MSRRPDWRTLLDPRDPDYVAPPDSDPEDFTEPDDDWPEHDGPEDYEGTARYHY